MGHRRAGAARHATPEGEGAGTIPLACRLHWHDWSMMSTEDGRRYQACRKCLHEGSRTWWGNSAFGPYEER